MSAIVPSSLRAALHALAASPDATVLAGGTDLMVELNSGHRSVSSVVAVNRVPELCTWHHDREPGYLRQRRERHLGLHLSPGAIANRVVEVAGELHEQFSGQPVGRTRVTDIEQCLASGTVPGAFLEAGDGRDPIALGERTEGVQGCGEEGWAGTTERVRISGKFKPGSVSDHPALHLASSPVSPLA